MKTTTLVAAAILVATVVSGATSQETTRPDGRIPVFGKASSYKKADMQKLEKYYLVSLKHSVDPIVECTIGEVTRLKLAQMCCQSDEIQKQLNKLAHEGRSPAIRYKAMLACMVFEHPAFFTQESSSDYAYSEDLFGAVAHRLEKELLAVNIQ
jgi:hypothetical protein